MRKLLLIFTLLFSTVIFSSTSYGDWLKMGITKVGSTEYVDFERIKKNGLYVYWWQLSDYLKPVKLVMLSAALYKQGDCELFRYKVLSVSAHKQTMGEGTGEVAEPVKVLEGWIHPPSNSAIERTLKKVCMVVQKYKEQ